MPKADASAQALPPLTVPPQPAPMPVQQALPDMSVFPPQPAPAPPQQLPQLPTLPQPAPVQQAPAPQQVAPSAPQQPQAPVQQFAPPPAQIPTPAPAPVQMPVQPAPAPVPFAPQPTIPGQPQFTVPGGYDANQLAGMMQQMQSRTPLSNALDINLTEIDLTGIEAGGFRLLPIVDAAGNPIEYEAVIEECNKKINEDTGGVSIELVLKISHGEYRDVKLWDYCSLKDQSLWKLKSLAGACGLLSPDGSRVMANSLTAFVGRVVRFTARHDTFNNQKRNKVAGGYSQAFETQF